LIIQFIYEYLIARVGCCVFCVPNLRWLFGLLWYMALGMSKLFGIDLLRNFNYPYFFSRDIRVLEALAHFAFFLVQKIYLYIPLEVLEWLWKIEILFIISWLVVFGRSQLTLSLGGFINALYFLPLLILNRNRLNIVVVGLNWILWY
jgi:D-alanyl-lipoteichoic acid acyltransferase DltB (MBOAT superfamily)